MKIDRWELLPYRHTPPSPIRAGLATLTERRGLLIRLYDERGRVGQGEAAPLPSFGFDDVGKAQMALERELGDLAEIDDTAPVETLLGLLPECPDSASATFALETAVLDLVGQRREQSLAALLGKPRRELVVAALLSGNTAAELVDEAQMRVDQGYAVLKVKCGTRAIKDELKVFTKLRSKFPDITFRLDANRAYRPREVVSVLKSLADMDPEFIEEPVQGGIACLPEGETLPIPVAADESLAQATPADLDALIKQGAATTWVLKPMVHGGMRRCITLAHQAHRLGIRLVVTHFMDGPVGFSATAALALALPGSLLAAGLADHPVLQTFRVKPPSLHKTKIIFSPALGLGLPLVEPTA